MHTNSEAATNTGVFSDPTWCILELMGHRRKVGRITQVEVFGAKMCRIEVLNIGDGFHTEFYGGSAIYACTPVSEEVARMKAKRTIDAQAPLAPWDMSGVIKAAERRGEENAAKRLTAPQGAQAEVATAEDRDEFDDDLPF